MTDYTPFTGRRNEQPAPIDLVRPLWTMERPGKTAITAAIFKVATGRELRVYQGDPDNLRVSLLSRTGDAPLEARAEELQKTLLDAGWTSEAPTQS